MALGEAASVSLIPVSTVNASGREEGGAAGPGEGGSFPSPSFRVG